MSLFKYSAAGCALWRWTAPAGTYRYVSDMRLAGSTALYAAGAVDGRGLVVKLRR